jgi:transketolase
MAAEKLQKDLGKKIKVINLPWLNCLDFEWLSRELGQIVNIISMDNHYLIGGQGDRISELFSSHKFSGKKLHRIALQTVPNSGSNAECLLKYKMDSNGIIEKVCQIFESEKEIR